jgi:hypothetical protein
MGATWNLALTTNGDGTVTMPAADLNKLLADFSAMGRREDSRNADALEQARAQLADQRAERARAQKLADLAEAAWALLSVLDWDRQPEGWKYAARDWAGAYKGDRAFRATGLPNASPLAVFAPYWPDGLEANEVLRLACDDDGRLKDAHLSLVIANDGDVHLAMQAYHDDAGEPDRQFNALPSIRVRTLQGGGRNLRTLQALRWLALAMKLDAADRGGR